jgi:hypothetical protein
MDLPTTLGGAHKLPHFYVFEMGWDTAGTPCKSTRGPLSSGAKKATQLDRYLSN